MNRSPFVDRLAKRPDEEGVENRSWCSVRKRRRARVHVKQRHIGEVARRERLETVWVAAAPRTKMRMPLPTQASASSGDIARFVQYRHGSAQYSTWLPDRRWYRMADLEPHCATHGLIEAGQNPRRRVAFGDGAADLSAPDGM
jgi:hypothetical protein